MTKKATRRDLLLEHLVLHHRRAIYRLVAGEDLYAYGIQVRPAMTWLAVNHLLAAGTTPNAMAKAVGCRCLTPLAVVR